MSVDDRQTPPQGGGPPGGGGGGRRRRRRGRGGGGQARTPSGPGGQAAPPGGSAPRAQQSGRPQFSAPRDRQEQRPPGVDPPPRATAPPMAAISPTPVRAPAPRDEETSPVATLAEPAVERTLTPPEPVEPRDPEGEDVFVGAMDQVPQGALCNVVGIKFRPAGTLFEYDAGELSLNVGDRVLVDTERGHLPAAVAVASRRLPKVEVLRRVVRRAGPGDQALIDRTAEREQSSYRLCRDRIRQRKLPMKVLRVEYPLSSGRALIYFMSEERIDFRDLVKDLSHELRMRVEMRQVGARDEAKMVGGIGSCGRELCCSTFLPNFAPVSIKMAKDQSLVLNPSKLAGQCGRLKCCLVYEQEIYQEMRKGMPKVGKRVSTPSGEGKVVEVDVLRQRVRVWFMEGGAETFPANVVTQLAPPPQMPRSQAQKRPDAGAGSGTSEPDDGTHH